jgi:protein-S-isoprenylcysteine O-methyltransferase Ste14
MINEANYHIAFIILLGMLLAMRFYFMVKVRRSGGRLMPDQKAVDREGGRGMLIIRITMFFLLIAFLVMYIVGMAWIDLVSFSLPDWLRWTGFALGILSVAFWTWTQFALDTQWSAQLQLRQGHHLVKTGPYALIRHPLYSAMFGWAIAVALLTANWIFTALAVLSIVLTMLRIPKEEQMMIDAFGDEYKTYMQRTDRFFPMKRK